ncbi:MAG: AraC family transcriptional regulator [Verrucomicrobiales bacterium]|nr:AraC family transcriptional regulator [Verrucomicrobiales bacterium]
METTGLRLREEFLNSITPGIGFERLFDHIPGILFFAKDREGHLIAANRALLALYGYQNENEFWGTTDFDHLPESLAEKFRNDDLQVIESGEPMLEIVEIFMNRTGNPAWFLTNKMPVFSRSGEVIGVMGTIQDYEEQRKLLPVDSDLSPALEFIQANYHRDVSVPKLAEMSGLSVRQFERRFKEHLKTTPQQFIVKMRVHATCDDLRRSKRSLAEIATHFGFYDQAAFSKYFKKHMGMTPMQYRKTYC